MTRRVLSAIYRKKRLGGSLQSELSTSRDSGQFNIDKVYNQIVGNKVVDK